MAQLSSLTSSGPMVDILSQSGRIVAADTGQTAWLGYAQGALDGGDWARLYPLTSRERLEGLFAAEQPDPMVVALHLRAQDGALHAVTAVAERIEDAEHGPCLRLTKWAQGGALDDVARLAEENEVLSGILSASDDAGWCMEWADPVDLSAPEQEIIRQVFENGARWRFCNAAMARLYHTPEGQDFNQLPVHETFPRNSQNEDFIRRLVRAGFDINGTPSRDLRYDGVYIEVENDVRGHIRGNRLYRMWGTVRDVSKHMRRLALVREEMDQLEAVFAALPDAVIVFDGDGAVLQANLAAEELLGLSAEALSSSTLGDLLDPDMTVETLVSGTRAGGARSRGLATFVQTPTGRVPVEITSRPFDHGGADCLVLCLRVAQRGPIGVVTGSAGKALEG